MVQTDDIQSDVELIQSLFRAIIVKDRHNTNQVSNNDESDSLILSAQSTFRAVITKSSYSYDTQNSNEAQKADDLVLAQSVFRSQIHKSKYKTIENQSSTINHDDQLSTHASNTCKRTDSHNLSHQFFSSPFDRNQTKHQTVKNDENMYNVEIQSSQHKQQPQVQIHSQPSDHGMHNMIKPTKEISSRKKLFESPETQQNGKEKLSYFEELDARMNKRLKTLKRERLEKYRKQREKREAYLIENKKKEEQSRLFSRKMRQITKACDKQRERNIAQAMDQETIESTHLPKIPNNNAKHMSPIPNQNINKRNTSPMITQLNFNNRKLTKNEKSPQQLEIDRYNNIYKEMRKARLNNILNQHKGHNNNNFNQKPNILITNHLSPQYHLKNTAGLSSSIKSNTNTPPIRELNQRQLQMQRKSRRKYDSAREQETAAKARFMSSHRAEMNLHSNQNTETLYPNAFEKIRKLRHNANTNSNQVGRYHNDLEMMRKLRNNQRNYSEKVRQMFAPKISVAKRAELERNYYKLTHPINVKNPQRLLKNRVDMKNKISLIKPSNRYRIKNPFKNQSVSTKVKSNFDKEEELSNFSEYELQNQSQFVFSTDWQN